MGDELHTHGAPPSCSAAAGCCIQAAQVAGAGRLLAAAAGAGALQPLEVPHDSPPFPDRNLKPTCASSAPQVWTLVTFSIFTALMLAAKKNYTAALIMLFTQLPALLMYHR